MIAEDTSRREGAVSSTSSTVFATSSTVSTTPSTVSATLNIDRPRSVQTSQSFTAQFHQGNIGREDSSIRAEQEQYSKYSKEQVNMAGVNFAKVNSWESDSVIMQELEILNVKDVQPGPGEYVLPLPEEIVQADPNHVQPVQTEGVQQVPAEEAQLVLEESTSTFIEMHPGNSPFAEGEKKSQLEGQELKVSAVVHGPESQNLFSKMYGCASCGKQFSSYQALGGHTSVHTAEVFVPKPVPAEASDGVVTVRQVMDDSRRKFYHSGIGVDGVKSIREQYRSLASYKRKSFADSDAFLFLSEKFSCDDQKPKQDEIKQKEDEDANMSSNAKLDYEDVRIGRKRGHYKSFNELGLKQRKRRTDELFLSLKRTANKNNVSPLIISAELTRRLEAAKHTDHEKWALDVLSDQNHDEKDSLNLSLFFKTQVGGRRKYNRLKNALSKKRRTSILPHHRMIAHRNVVLPKIYKIKNSENFTIGVMSTLKETMRKFYSRLLNKIGYRGSGYLKGSLKVSSDSAVHKKFNQLSGNKDFIEAGVEEVTKADLVRPSEFQNISICKLETVPAEDVQQVPAEDVQPVQVEDVQPVPADVQQVLAEDVQPVRAEDVQLPAEVVQPVPAEDVQPVPAEDVQPVPAEYYQPVSEEEDSCMVESRGVLGKVVDTQYAEDLGIASKGDVTKNEFGNDSKDSENIMEEQLDMINIEVENSERELDWEYQLLRNFGVSSLGSFLGLLSETAKIASGKKGDSWSLFYQETIPGYFGKLLSWLISATDPFTDQQIVDLYSNLEIFVNSYSLSPLSDDDCWHDLINVLTEAFLELTSKSVEKLGSSIFRHSIEDLDELEQMLLRILQQIGENQIIVKHLSWKLRTMEGGRLMVGAVVIVIKMLPCTEFGDVLAAATEVMDELEVDQKMCAALDILNCVEVLESNNVEHLLISRIVQPIESYLSKKGLTLYQNVTNLERFVERLPQLPHWEPETQREPELLVNKLLTFPVHVPLPSTDFSFQNIETNKRGVVTFIPERPSILEILQDLDLVNQQNDYSEDVTARVQVSQGTSARINIGDSWDTKHIMETSETVSSHLEQLEERLEETSTDFAAAAPESSPLSTALPVGDGMSVSSPQNIADPSLHAVQPTCLGPPGLMDHRPNNSQSELLSDISHTHSSGSPQSVLPQDMIASPSSGLEHAPPDLTSQSVTQLRHSISSSSMESHDLQYEFISQGMPDVTEGQQGEGSGQGGGSTQPQQPHHVNAPDILQTESGTPAMTSVPGSDRNLYMETGELMEEDAVQFEMNGKREQNAVVATLELDDLKLKLSCMNGIWQVVTNKPAKKKRIVLKIKLWKGRFPKIIKATRKRKQKKVKKLKQKTTVSINSCGAVPLTLKDQMTGESVFFEKHPNSESSMQHLALIEGKEGLELLNEYLIGLGRERRELIEEGLEVEYGEGELAIVNFEEESIVGVADQKFTAMINGDGGNPCMCAVKKDKWWDRNQILAGFPISFDISTANAIYDDIDKKPNGKLKTKVGDIETRHGQVNKPVFEDWGWSKVSPCHSKIHLLEQCLNVADHLRAGMSSRSFDASFNSYFIIFRMYR